MVRVNVVLNRTVVVDSDDWRFHNLCGSHLQSQSELYHVSWWYYTLVIDPIGLTRRAQLARDSPDSLQDETDYLNNVYSKNNYNTDFVRRNTDSNTDTNTQTNSGPVTTATKPYIRGTSETIARILQPYNIRVAHKPITTLRRLPTNVKDKDKPEDRQGAVYKIKCCDCQASYIGENVSTRLTEHKRATKNGDVNNHIAEHHLKTKHQIDWDSATCRDMYNVFYRLLSTSYFRKLVY